VSSEGLNGSWCIISRRPHDKVLNPPQIKIKKEKQQSSPQEEEPNNGLNIIGRVIRFNNLVSNYICRRPHAKVPQPSSPFKS
jgi:hypothetical protein